ncbi:TPM domain-containing protein [Aeoliella sp.]|uniref:TPM domain-containing protein n=1 Tax=Aeoliella sp. TaxID=2795800 RepID=UPI003CCC1983
MKTDALRALVVLVVLAPMSTAQQQPPAAPDAEQGLVQQGNYAPYPEPDAGYVTDLAGLLPTEDEEQIEQWLWDVEERTGVEIAVVTINSIRDYPGTANDSIESFATGLFDKYGIGNLPKNDGVLLVVARNDRKARIELGKAYGRARDADAVAIMEGRIIPQFKEDRYAQGITNGVRGIMLEFADVRVGTNWPLIALLVAIPIVGAIAFSLFRSGKRGWGWVCVGILFILLLAVLQILVTVLKSGGSGGSGSSSSWSSGGFGGGFGGGSSGGGGATGSW